MIDPHRKILMRYASVSGRGRLQPHASTLFPVVLMFSLALASGPDVVATTRGQELGAQEREEKPAGALPIGRLRLVVEGESISVYISNAPFRKVLAKLAAEADMRIFLAHTVSDDEVSDVFEDLPIETGIKRLLVGKGYALRYAPTPSDAKEANSISKRRITELHVVPKDTGVMPAYHMEELAAPEEKGVGKDAALLTKALHGEIAAERATALKKYLKEAGEPDYSEVAKALKDADSKVRRIAQEGMEDSDTLPTSAITESALTDTEPTLRMNALRILVERKAAGATATLEKALTDPDPRVKAYAREMATLVETIEAFKARRKVN